MSVSRRDYQIDPARMSTKICLVIPHHFVGSFANAGWLPQSNSILSHGARTCRLYINHLSGQVGYFYAYERRREDFVTIRPLISVTCRMGSCKAEGYQ